MCEEEEKMRREDEKREYYSYGGMQYVIYSNAEHTFLYIKTLYTLRETNEYIFLF